MADAEYRVRLVIEDDLQGATDSVAAMDRVEKKVDDIRAKLGKQSEAEKPLAEIPPAADAATKKLNELNNEAAKRGMKPVAENAKEAKAGLEQAAEAARQAIGGVQASSGSFEGLGRVLKTLREESNQTGESTAGLAGVMTRLGPVVAAALASFNAGRWLAELSESMDGAAADAIAQGQAIAAGLHQAAETKVKFSGIEQGAKEAIAQLDAVLNRMEQIRTAEQRRLAAETRGTVADINARAAVDMAGAETQAQKDAIRRRADAEIAAAQGAAELTKTQQDLRAEEIRYNETVAKKNAVSEALAKIEQEAVEKQARVNELLDRKIAAGLTRPEAIQDPEVARAVTAASGAKQASEDSPLRKELEDIKATTAAQVENIQTLSATIQALRTEQQTKAVEFGADSQRSFNDLKAAIDANTAAQASAKERLATAQATQGPTEQTAAYASFQRLQEEGNKLRAELDRQAAFMSDASAKYREFNVGIGGVIQETAAQSVRAKEQAEKTKVEVKKSTDDVVGAAGELTKATTGATATMTGAVDNLGKQVTGGFQEVATQIQRMASQTAAQLQSMQGQIDRISVTANAALENAAVANNRINAGR